MKKLLGLFICLLTAFVITQHAEASPVKKSNLPDCTVTVCQSVDVATPAADFLLPDYTGIETQSLAITKPVESVPLVTQALDQGFYRCTLYANNYLDRRDEILVPVPIVMHLNSAGQLNHYTRSKTFANTSRHV